MEQNSCAFTGHRPAQFGWGYDEQHPDCVKLKLLLEDEIVKLCELGVITFITGMAQGVDQWAALSVLKLRQTFPALRLVCALPCEGQTKGWSDGAKIQYHTILEQADSVQYISPTYTKDCMIVRNHWMVDHANFVLAVYDGSYRGGTAATVRYAQKKDRRITQIHPASFEVTCTPDDWGKQHNPSI